MKNHIHKSLDRLLKDRTLETKISMYVPVQGDMPAHVILASLRESAIKLLPDKILADSFRKWLGIIRNRSHQYKDARAIACFFSESGQEIIILDHEVPPRVVVSHSWHIKPLLFAADSRPWGHIIEFNDEGISLLRSDGMSHELVETFFPTVKSQLPSKFWPEELDRSSLKELINNIVKRIPEESVTMISGAPDGFAESPSYWRLFLRHVYVDKKRIGETAREEKIVKFAEFLADYETEIAPLSVLKELSGYAAYTDPVVIARRILEGKVSCLFISLEAIQWGEVDFESGSIKKSKFQKDHLDEDVLDDIAELALREGVEVRILRQSSFPIDIEIMAA